jgi:hypothetical protein
LNDVFVNVEGIHVCNTFSDIYNGNGVSANTQVIIMQQYSFEDAVSEDDGEVGLRDKFEVHGIHYELRFVALIQHDFINDTKYKAEVYMRHGESHCGWWYQNRNDHMCIQSSTPPTIRCDRKNIVVYVQVHNIDVPAMNADFLKYLGGQAHVNCNAHKFPMIRSSTKDQKCNCGRNEHLRCPRVGCKVTICKRCFDVLNMNKMHYISNTDANVEGNHEVEDISDEDESVTNSLPNLDYNSDSDDEEHDEGCCSNSEPNLNEPYTDEEEELLENGWDTNSCNMCDDISNSEDWYGDDLNSEEGETNTHGEHNNRERNVFDGKEHDALERDDFDNFVTSSDPPDMPVVDENEMFNQASIPTTNAGEFAFEVEEEIPDDRVHISGHVILNQCGSVLTRKKHQIKGSKLQEWFLQRIVATLNGKSVSLLYPEGMIFPSIFYKMAEDGSIIGSIFLPLLTLGISRYGFALIPQHIRCRLTSAGVATGTNPRYISFSFDTVTNLSANHFDSRIAMNKGLTAGDDEFGGLGLRSGKDSPLLGSIDSKQMVKNLAASQKWLEMDYFLTFTCNQKKHFGTKPIKHWLDSMDWCKHFPGYEKLTKREKKEIEVAIRQSSATLFLRVWNKVTNFF